jgi:hypothetical protein
LILETKICSECAKALERNKVKHREVEKESCMGAGTKEEEGWCIFSARPRKMEAAHSERSTTCQDQEMEKGSFPSSYPLPLQNGFVVGLTSSIGALSSSSPCSAKALFEIPSARPAFPPSQLSHSASATAPAATDPTPTLFPA